MSYKDTVFSLYGSYVAEHDSYHDRDGKGLFERFNELLGQDLDDNTIPMVKDIVDNMMVPATMMDKFIRLLMAQIGFTPIMPIDRESLVKLFSMMRTIYDKRGLKSCQEILLKFIGVNSIEYESQETYTVRGFDSELSLDSGRTLDSISSNTFYYNLKLTGTEKLSDSLVESILSILFFSLPYYIILVRLYYNEELVFINGLLEIYAVKDYAVTGYVEDDFELNNIYVN